MHSVEWMWFSRGKNSALAWLNLWDQRREPVRGDEVIFSFVHFVKLHMQYLIFIFKN